MKVNLTNGISFFALVLIVGALFLTFFTGAFNSECRPGDDVCIEKAIETLNQSKASEMAFIAENLSTWTKRQAETESSYNERIRSQALKYSLGGALERQQKTEGGDTSIPSEITSLKSFLIPSANADTSTDITLNTISKPDQPAIVKSDAPVQTNENDTYQKIAIYLARKNAPYKDLDFKHIASRTGVTPEQALLLISITGHESAFGNAYARSEGKKVISASTDEGREYHNYAGVKWCVAVEDCPERTSIPDDRGFWLQKYDSDEQFFSTFFVQMKKGYFDKGCETSGCISQWYVGGVFNKKQAWSRAVNNFISEIKETKTY